MDFKELQLKIIQNAKNYGTRYKVKIDQEFGILKLVEEIGEFAEAVLTHDKKSRPEKRLSPKKAKTKLAKELADVVGMAIVNADIFGVNLEEAIYEKWIEKKE